MKIPKHISHPLILLVVLFAVAGVVWLDRPQASDADNAGKSANGESVSTADKHSFLTQNNLYQISDLLPEGYVVIDELNKKWQIAHERFRQLTPDQTNQLKEFFVGRFVKLRDPKTQSTIELPMELYNPVCFSNTEDDRLLSLECPLVLEP